MDPRTLVLGTAGHIDHGKTALVGALTGIDTDRLQQEKERGISIDLGFAHLDLGGVRLGIVDVPGHERFVKNMLAGASGIDIALLVVAADDSVMPQTREHLAITQLLGVPRGLVAITKVDVAEPEWVELVEQDVRELVAGTFLEGAPIVRTSATTGTGLDELRETVAAIAAGVEERPEHALFRMPVDRAFVMEGLGTVVTGTVWSGRVATGDELDWLPTGRTVRIRGIQSHGRDVDVAHEGQRAALILAGAHHRDVQRGHELATRNSLRPSRRLTARLDVLAESPWPVRHRGRVRLHLGTQEIIASVTCLEPREIPPGERGLVQFECAEDTVARALDAFVVRSESPLRTIGGGIVLDPAARRIARRDHAAIAALAARSSDDATERAAATVRGYGTAPWTALDLVRDAALDPDAVDGVLAALAEAGDLVTLAAGPREVRVHRETLEGIADRVLKLVERTHANQPLLPAIPRRELLGRLRGVDEDLALAVIERLVATERLAGEATVRLPGFEPSLTAGQKRLRERLVTGYREAGLRPPEPASLAGAVPGDQLRAVLDLCVAQGELAHVDADLYLHRDAERALRTKVADALATRGSLAMSDIRDALDITRKYAVPYGEYLDRVGVTKRRGDVRVLRDDAV